MKYQSYDKLANELTDPSTSCKTLCSILKRFCNNQKILMIPPLYIGNKSECDFRLKTTI